MKERTNMSVSQKLIEEIAYRLTRDGIAAVLTEGRDIDLDALRRDAAKELRELLERNGVTVQRKRVAIVESQREEGQALEVVQSYLPANYTACNSEGTIHGKGILIEGYDNAGWTLHEYVIPRLASGLIVAKEVK